MMVVLCLSVLVGLASTTWAGEAEAVAKGPHPCPPAYGRQPEVVAYDNGDVSSWADYFLFDSPVHPKLVALREKYKLDEVVKDAKTDLERALALKEWVNSLMRFGQPKPDMFEDWSAVAILEKYEKGDAGWCGQFAMVFQQACLVMGLPARYIELGVPDNPACHFTTEVYLREHEKWAVVDSTGLAGYNVYYTLDGVPQSALEMHYHVLRKTLPEVMEVHPTGSRPAGGGGPSSAFYYVRWLTRCDVVTNTPEFIDMEHVFDRVYGTVAWRSEDETLQWVPWEESKHTNWVIRNTRMSAWNTSDPDVVNWKPTDRARIVLRPSGRNDVFVHLWHADMNFDHFRVRVDERPWEDMPKKNVYDQAHYQWGKYRCRFRNLRGAHIVQAQIVRGDGSTGPISWARFNN